MFQLFLTYAVLSACLLVRYTVTQYEKDAKQPVTDLGCLQYPLCSSLSCQFVTSLRVNRSLQLGPVCRNKSVLLYLCSLLLAQSYAPEPNPGPRPVKFHCVICERAVRSNTRGVCCDSCDRWYQQECMGMPEGVYNGLKSVSWECFHCGVPNFDTCRFTNPVATSSPSKVTPGQTDVPLRTLVINCQSIKTPGKPAQLQNLIQSTRADIIIGTESWLSPEIKSAEVFPPNFRIYRRDRPKGQGGGVFVLVSSLYESEEPEELKVDQVCELVWAKVKVHGSKDLYVGSFYRPPDNHDPEYLMRLQSYITRIPIHNDVHLWLGGDFNLADIDWGNECVKPYPAHGAQCQQLLNIAKDSFLEQVVTEPTRVTETSSNILDLFFTNNETLVNQVHIVLGIADHEPVFLESSLRPIKAKAAPRKVYQYKKADYEGFKSELREYATEFQKISNSEDIDTLWTKFKGNIHQLMEKYIPQKQLPGNKVQKPWIDKHVKALQRKRNKLFKRQRATHRAKDISHFRQMKAKVQRAERQAY